MTVETVGTNTSKLVKELTKRGLEKQGLNWGWLNSETTPRLWEEIQNILGFPLQTDPTDVMTIPYLDTYGNQLLQPNGKPYVRFRLQNPGHSAKYQSPKGSGLHIYFSPTVDPETWQHVKETRTIPLILVEGEVKAEYLNQILGKSKNPIAYAIGLPGIWGWVLGKQTLSNNKGLTYFMEAIAFSKSQSVKNALQKLEGNERKEMQEVLEAWHEMAAFDKATKKTNSRPLEGKLEDWLSYKENNRVYPGYTEALTWDLEDELEELKATYSSSKHSAVVTKVNSLLQAQEEKQKEGHTITPELQHFKLHGRTVLICFDSDIQSSGIQEDGHYAKGTIAGAARALSIELLKLSAKPQMMLLPKPVRFQTNLLDMGSVDDPYEIDKFGVDDYGLLYGERAVYDLVTVSLEQEKLAVIPYSLEPLATRKNIYTYKLNIRPDEATYMCWVKSFLRNRANIAYRHNDATYQWNGKHWEKVYSEFQELLVAEAYLQNTTGRVINLTKSAVLKMLTVDDKLWNHKANEWVLYTNGSYNFFTREFKSGFEKEDYCTFAPIKAVYKELQDFNPETFKTLVEYINYYSGGDDKFLQYIMASIRWTVAPKSRYEKLPVEKFFSLVGHQGSGKSTMLTMIQKAVGLDNCHRFTKDKLGTPEGLHQYADQKMLFNSDASGSISKEAAENINMMVSGEVVETRALFKQSRQIKMQPVIWLAGNEILNFGITGTQGLSRRLITIPIERGKGLKVDGYLTEKLTSEEYQSALFYLYRQLDERDMVSILNHTRYMPTTVKHRTVAHGKEQNPLREFWEHLDSRWTETEKQTKGFTREQLMIAFKTWADLNNQYEYKVQKIMVHLKEIDAVAPKLNEKGVQYKYTGVPYFVLNPYKDHSPADLRLTYDEENGRPLILINPHDYLGDTSSEVVVEEELPTIMERLTEAREKRENTIQEHPPEDVIQEDISRNTSFDSYESFEAEEFQNSLDLQSKESYRDWEVDVNGDSEAPKIQGIPGSFGLLRLENSNSDESGDNPETYLYQ